MGQFSCRNGSIHSKRIHKKINNFEKIKKDFYAPTPNTLNNLFFIALWHGTAYNFIEQFNEKLKIKICYIAPGSQANKNYAFLVDDTMTIEDLKEELFSLSANFEIQKQHLFPILSLALQHPYFVRGLHGEELKNDMLVQSIIKDHNITELRLTITK